MRRVYFLVMCVSPHSRYSPSFQEWRLRRATLQGWATHIRAAQLEQEFSDTNALQGDDNNRVYVLGHKHVLGPTQTHFSFSGPYSTVRTAKFKSLFWSPYEMSLWTQRYNKYLTNLVFSVGTVSYGSSFFPLGSMARALRAKVFVLFYHGYRSRNLFFIVIFYILGAFKKKKQNNYPTRVC